MSVCVCASAICCAPMATSSLSKLPLQLPFLLAALKAGLRGVDLRGGFGIVGLNRRASSVCCQCRRPQLSRRYQPLTLSPKSLLTMRW